MTIKLVGKIGESTSSLSTNSEDQTDFSGAISHSPGSKNQVFAFIADNLTVTRKVIEDRYQHYVRTNNLLHHPDGNTILADIHLMSLLNKSITQGTFKGHKPALSTSDLINNIKEKLHFTDTVRQAVSEIVETKTFMQTPSVLHGYVKRALYALANNKQGEAQAMLVKLLELTDEN